MKLFGTKRGAAHYGKRVQGGRAPAPERDWDDEPYQERAEKPRRKKKKKRSVVKRVFVVLLVVLLLITGGIYALWAFNVEPPIGWVFDFDSWGSDGGSDGEVEDFANFEREIFTIVVAGQDGPGAFGRTDTLMVVSVDTGDGGSVNVVNIPRDTMADVSWNPRRINSVLPITRSADRLVDEVERMIGFRPDGYVIVDLDAFEALVDTIGGVEFNVPIRMLYSDPYDDPPLFIDLHPGYQHLNGARALQLVRFRAGYTDADIGRIRTQQAFLGAVAAELLQIRNVTRIGDLVRIFVDYVDTDLTVGNLIWFATEMMYTDSENVNFHTLPGQYDAWIGGVSYVILDLDEWLEMVNAYLNPLPVPVTEDNVRVVTRRDGSVQVVGGDRTLTPR
ncbi:MAG: LCP family protein [Oscillospiraceae bacterium]|nr:LCP family protein [Oscillospiraceae bacterium]